MLRVLRRVSVPVRLFGGIVIAVLVFSIVIRVIAGSSATYSYVLAEGDTYRGDLAVAAQTVVFSPGSTVTGNVAVMALDSVRIAGKIEGQVSILSPTGEVKVESGAVIRGTLTVCARNLVIFDRQAIGGGLNTGCDQLGAFASGSFAAGPGLEARIPAIPIPFVGRYRGDLVSQIFQIVLTSCVVAAIAAVLALITPTLLNRMSETAWRRPRTAGTVGILTIGVAFGLTVLYGLFSALTLGLLCAAVPIIALSWVVLTAALVIGWIAASYPLGRLIFYRLRGEPSPVVAAAGGALLLTLVHGLLEIIPFTGWLAGLLLIVVGSVGLGAVLLTRLGTRAFPEMVEQQSV